MADQRLKRRHLRPGLPPGFILLFCAHGARALPPADARALWDAILDRRLPQAMIGAALMAFRFKGETVDEIGALLDAAQARAGALGAAAGHRLVCLPCYNGARRMPNLAWLMALALRETGCPVLLHGVRRQAGRLTTCEGVWSSCAHRCSKTAFLSGSMSTVRRAVRDSFDIR